MESRLDLVAMGVPVDLDSAVDPVAMEVPAQEGYHQIHKPQPHNSRDHVTPHMEFGIRRSVPGLSMCSRDSWDRNPPSHRTYRHIHIWSEDRALLPGPTHILWS